MNAIENPAVAAWRARFAADAAAALGQALAGQISLGAYDRARPAEALAQILAEADLPGADAGLQAWLAGHLGRPTPPGLTAKRFADALLEAFRLIALLHLKECRAWCAEHHGVLRGWLRGFYFGRSRDPEGALLVALAQDQADRGLLPLWQAVVRRGRPVDHVRQALTGLRLLPDAERKEHALPRALLQGLLDFGNALAGRGERKGDDWLLEVDYLAAIHPLSPEAWGRKFREVVQAREPAPAVKNWLGQRYPLALKPFEGGKKAPLQPPYFKGVQPLLQKLDSHYAEVRPQLRQFFDDSRYYCRESGDSYYLVRSFCFAGDRLLNVDPIWTRELAHEAAVWAPTNPQTWSLLARALEAEGDWRRAEAVFWQARRRFAENAQSHNQLAHALLLHGQGELGEAVYRQAIGLFPDNPICRADLGHTLRVLGRPEEALAVYREAQDRFHRDIVVANALADLLIGMNRLDEAADALDWAEQILPADDRHNERILADIRQRLRQAQSGQPIVVRKLPERRETAGGDLSALADLGGGDLAMAATLGQATLRRRQANGHLAAARGLIGSLPESPEKLVERGLWEAAAAGWPAAAAWFDGVWQGYGGDGVLRVHRQRAHARAGMAVDWAAERNQYPELLAVILAEERGQPPRVELPDDEDLRSQEQVQDAWFADLLGRGEDALRDLAEEDYLAARHLS